MNGVAMMVAVIILEESSERPCGGLGGRELKIAREEECRKGNGESYDSHIGTIPVHRISGRG